MDDGRMAGTHLAYTHTHIYGREMVCELPFTYLGVRKTRAMMSDENRSSNM